MVSLLNRNWARMLKSDDESFFLFGGGFKFFYRDSFSFGCLVFVESHGSWTRPADYATRPRNEFKSGFASVHFNVVTAVLLSHFMLSSLIRLIIQLERIQICVCFGSILSPPPSLFTALWRLLSIGLHPRATSFVPAWAWGVHQRQEYCTFENSKSLSSFFLHSKSFQFSFWTIANLFHPGSVVLVGKSFLACERERLMDERSGFVKKSFRPDWWKETIPTDHS